MSRPLDKLGAGSERSKGLPGSDPREVQLIESVSPEVLRCPQDDDLRGTRRFSDISRAVTLVTRSQLPRHLAHLRHHAIPIEVALHPHPPGFTHLSGRSPVAEELHKRRGCR